MFYFQVVKGNETQNINGWSTDAGIASCYDQKPPFFAHFPAIFAGYQTVSPPKVHGKHTGLVNWDVTLFPGDRLRSGRGEMRLPMNLFAG